MFKDRYMLNMKKKGYLILSKVIIRMKFGVGSLPTTVVTFAALTWDENDMKECSVGELTHESIP